MPDLSLILEPATDDDAAPIERLNERVFGPGRFARTAYRIRETTPSDPRLSFVARVGTLLVGASAMTPIAIGAAPALLLGPLIVEPVFRSQGIGEALVTRSLEAAKAAGWKLVILVGDEPYYARMGFQRAPVGRISLPGPVDPARLLYCELEPGALAAAKGEARGPEQWRHGRLITLSNYYVPAKRLNALSNRANSVYLAAIRGPSPWRSSNFRRSAVVSNGRRSRSLSSFTGCGYLATFFYRDLPWWGLTAIGAWTIAWQLNLQHETIHGHPTRNRRINEAIGCWPLSLWLPYSIYRSTHLAHHRDENLTDPLDDPESYYWADGQWRALGPLGRALVAAQSTLLGRMILGPAWTIPRFVRGLARDVWRGKGKTRVIVGAAPPLNARSFSSG